MQGRGDLTLCCIWCVRAVAGVAAPWSSLGTDLLVLHTTHYILNLRLLEHGS
ncbi:hypothetical protein PF005_g31804 [Phytophthora fragariae]|uniref:Uncharacterized protein n=1 Tax=Phytophthora fragariae TaxID=53985 RepID=A0A6A4B367_9STRA|nr:hypothetical protein PF003_g29799 [Phytophthora fragariae]KAE8919302.1 hypothetical protein PF009_g30389 [Phytophthora fragariae]KAE8956761.1 hypothetical protein PF011_g31370 [Phytophthora fragariae]KAE9070186.1 hypothetical protein PF006_g29408 [Phytophthora fragariae]KAE9070334.1 hypothetical protein PF010_g26317 [Phytophthora fragariae]